MITNKATARSRAASIRAFRSGAWRRTFDRLLQGAESGDISAFRAMCMMLHCWGGNRFPEQIQYGAEHVQRLWPRFYDHPMPDYVIPRHHQH